jgi:hypothetical protein
MQTDAKRRRGEATPPPILILEDTKNENGLPITPNEVLDAIVEYEGGIASGYQIRSIISRVYGVELS